MKNIVALFLLCFLVGCSWTSQMSYKGRAYLGLTKESLVLNDKSSLDGAGIVIGRVIRENVTGGFADYIDRKVIIKNLATGQELNYYDGDYFFIRLVEGQYAIVGFETKMGIPLRSENRGFKFSVRNGEITYIGNILSEKSLRSRLNLESNQTLDQQSTSKVFYAGRYDGGASMFIPNSKGAYNFYVVDDKEKSVKQFKSLFPNLNEIEINSALMN